MGNGGDRRGELQKVETGMDDIVGYVETGEMPLQFRMGGESVNLRRTSEFSISTPKTIIDRLTF